MITVQQIKKECLSRIATVKLYLESETDTRAILCYNERIETFQRVIDLIDSEN